MLKNGNYLKHWKHPVIIKQVLIFWYEIDGQDLNDVRNNENFYIGITFFVVSIFQNPTKHYKNQNNKLWTIRLEKHGKNYISITTEMKMKVVLHIFHAAFFVLWALYNIRIKIQEYFWSLSRTASGFPILLLLLF